MVDQWHTQYAIHALAYHSGLVMLQLCRYTQEGTVGKDCAPLRIRSGQVIQVPVFSSDVGTAVRVESFVVGAIIMHLGPQVTQGHYQAYIGKPPPQPTDQPWLEYLCDDNKPPKKATAKDRRQMQASSDLVVLSRC